MSHYHYTVTFFQKKLLSSVLDKESMQNGPKQFDNTAVTFIFASLPYLAIRKIVTPDSYVTLSRYLLNSFAMFKSREIYHKYCLTILLNHDTSGHLARIHSSTFLSHYNILCCHTTLKINGILSHYLSAKIAEMCCFFFLVWKPLL